MLAGELGIVLEETWFQRTFGRANQDIIPEMMGRALTQASIDELSERKEAVFRRIAVARLPLFPGAFALVEGLATAGWRLGIGSSTPRANLDLVVPLLGLDGHMTATVGMEDVSRHKPEPDVFLEVARRLDVAPERCLVFEDAPAGIEAGQRAGMVPIAVTTHHPAQSFGLAQAIRDGLWSITASDCQEWLDGR